MIDAHIHVCPPSLIGVGYLGLGPNLSPATIAERLTKEMQQAGIHKAIALGALSGSTSDPLGTAATIEVAQHVPGLFVTGVANPEQTGPDFLHAADQVVSMDRVKAIKVYLGYLHYAPDHPGFLPYYRMAAHHDIPVIFHTGNTISPNARLRFAHPLLIDDIAVAFPDTRFVMAHCGNPWFSDAAAVIAKNMNVWADLSSLLPVSQMDFTLLRRTMQQKLLEAFYLANRPNRFLFGSDWPLSPMQATREMIAETFPPDYHAMLFEENARVLFKV